MGRRILDIAGCKFGRLTALKIASSTRKWVWECICECGNKIIVSGHNLRGGNTRSCGCLRVENAKRTIVVNGESTTHGMTKTPEYRSWIHMRERCYCSKDKDYKNYGGRGIKVCDRWLNSFENFFADMGLRPSGKHTLDRYPNKNGDYEPGNCRWATQKQQQNNRTNNRMIEYNGSILTLSQWSEKLGIKGTTISERLNIRGWTIEEALTF